MSTYKDAETKFAQVGPNKLAYRRLGKEEKGGPSPLLFLHHFRGTMDFWDPAIIDGFASSRPVILLDNAGIGHSTGTINDSIQAMADNVVQFIQAINVNKVDILGFSLGGCIAQLVALDAPERVGKIILAGTGPSKGEGVVHSDPSVLGAAATPEPGIDGMLYLFFSPTKTSEEKGRAWFSRLGQRNVAGEKPTKFVPLEAGVQNLAIALGGWNEDPLPFGRLGEIKAPVWVTNGHNDIMIPTVNSFVMAQRIPGAKLTIYPDSGHGHLFQYPEEYIRDATAGFLDL
jgi:pimeloyl-ACP methyl ester carboxylesterase